MKPIEQQFLDDLDKKLWTAADKLRSNLDAAVYKHVVLGLIFLKYVSDAFEERQKELREQFTDPEHDYYMDPAEYGGAGTQEYEEHIAAELEVRDYYTEKTCSGCQSRPAGKPCAIARNCRPRPRYRGTSRARTSPRKCARSAG